MPIQRAVGAEATTSACVLVDRRVGRKNFLLPLAFFRFVHALGDRGDAGDCGDFAPEPACDHLSPQGFYRKCHALSSDESHSDVFREVITVFVLP